MSSRASGFSEMGALGLKLANDIRDEDLDAPVGFDSNRQVSHANAPRNTPSSTSGSGFPWTKSYA